MILEPFSTGKGVVMNRPFTLNSFDSQLLPILAPLVHVHFLSSLSFPFPPY